MISSRLAASTLRYAVVFGLVALLGRQAVLPGTELALVWPAAGVAAAWLATTGWQRWLVVDAVVLLADSWVVNDVTGAGTGLALGLGVATVVQVLVLGMLLSRWHPEMWGFGDDPPRGVTRRRALGYLVGAAVLSTGVSALIGPPVAMSVGDARWTVLASWVVRNSTGVVAVFPLAMLVRHSTTVWRRTGTWPSVVPPGPGRRRTWVELAALVLVTVVVCWLVLVVNDDLPIPFLLLATSVWAGTRFAPEVAGTHAVLLAAGVVTLTVLDAGPFVAIEAGTDRAFVLQAYVGVVVVLTLALSVGRQEALGLHERLLASETAATAQATLVRTILDSMADGVTVVDATGSVVLQNPAAIELAGEVQRDLGRGDTVRGGLRHPDGRPVDPAEMPVARALAGEQVAHVDFFVRNPAAPEDRLLEVTATRLPDSDPPVAVVVFHDVTADRRERNELASFAGVVAHDLLNPLTIIEGWSEALAEEMQAPESKSPETQIGYLERIQRAAQRMQHLINELLAYTTARDLRINPVRVDLTALARDVARARVEASRVRTLAVPTITVGELPDVLGEPVLLRQVVDNLIGNSVKYVAPGVRPEIDVRARRVEDGMVLVEISDNGIGIPDGQHARVFDNFHRAHQDGYRGTGLGLSIVKRIVERHGGTVTARDNVGRGGTTMAATFPAADDHEDGH